MLPPTTASSLSMHHKEPALGSQPLPGARLQSVFTLFCKNPLLNSVISLFYCQQHF